jgi:hypothetical protein
MSMTHDEMVAVIEHHKNGGKVQYSVDAGETWHDAISHAWNFGSLRYRIKPEPMTIWLEINKWGKIDVAHYEKPETPTYKTTTLKKFVEVTE